MSHWNEVVQAPLVLNATQTLVAASHTVPRHIFCAQDSPTLASADAQTPAAHVRIPPDPQSLLEAHASPAFFGAGRATQTLLELHSAPSAHGPALSFW